MGRSHGTPQQKVGQTDRQTNTCESITFLHTTYAGDNNEMVGAKGLSKDSHAHSFITHVKMSSRIYDNLIW